MQEVAESCTTMATNIEIARLRIIYVGIVLKGVEITSRGIRDFGIVGPTGPKGPTYCPYCHSPYEIMPISVKETDYDDAKWWACYTNKLGYFQRIIYMQRECDFEPWTIAVESNPKFCEMCERPLNEEEE